VDGMTKMRRLRIPRPSRTHALIATGAALAAAVGFAIAGGGPATNPAGSITIAAVGDMNPAGNTSRSSAAGKNAAAISAGLADGSLTAFLALGDFQYEQGTCDTLVNQWGKLWGPVIEKTYHIAGPTHDAGRTDELGYRKFFNGECPGSTAKSAAVRHKGSSIGPFDPYSFDLGSWHFAMIPTAALRNSKPSVASLAEWLDQDLSAADRAGKHLAVAYHDPYFTSSTSHHSREAKEKPFIDVIDKHHVRLTLSGSQHNYERSCPVRADDTCTADDGRGATAFQVSTGGIGLRSFTDSPGYIVKRFSDTHGWLKLTLNADGSFSWAFNPVDGSSTDSGSRARPSES
jgi:acid phosphatase type 7